MPRWSTLARAAQRSPPITWSASSPPWPRTTRKPSGHGCPTSRSCPRSVVTPAALPQRRERAPRSRTTRLPSSSRPTAAAAECSRPSTSRPKRSSSSPPDYRGRSRGARPLFLPLTGEEHGGRRACAQRGTGTARPARATLANAPCFGTRAHRALGGRMHSRIHPAFTFITGTRPNVGAVEDILARFGQDVVSLLERARLRIVTLVASEQVRHG